MSIILPDDNPSDDEQVTYNRRASDREDPQQAARNGLFGSRRIFDQRITVSHIITTLTIAATILYSGTQIKERVRVLEEQRSQNTLLIDRVQRDSSDDLNLLRAQLNRQYDLLIRLEDKVDRIQAGD